MSNKKKVLCIVGKMDVGGAETFLMKILRNIDIEKYQIDFFVLSSTKGFYDDEIKSIGSKIYYSVPKSKTPITFLQQLRKIVKQGKYLNVMRLSQHSLSTIDLMIAKTSGAKNLIFRCSSTKTYNGIIGEILHKVFKFLPIMFVDTKIAPSKLAALFMFGKNAVFKNKVKILNNGLDLERYKFSESSRNDIRSLYGIKDSDFVIGHVGRLNWVKNHKFTLKVLKEIVKKNKKVKLLLVGDGELKEELNTIITKDNLNDYVIFTGIQKNVYDYMSAMDVFIFPSIFEGMPNTLIEAQCNNLSCIASDTITKEVKITNNIEFLSIENDIDITNWAIKISEKSNLDIRLRSQQLSKKVFDHYSIDNVVKEFEKCVFKY